MSRLDRTNTTAFALFSVFFVTAIAAHANDQTALGKRVLTEAGGVAGGRRYVGNDAVRIFARPDAYSRVIYDLAPGVIMYGSPSSPGWVRITSIGTLQHRVNNESQPITLNASGQLNIAQGENDEFIYKANGFVRADVLSDFDGRLGFSEAVLQDVPQPWLSLGILDQRKFVVQKAAHPFDAIVRIEQRYPAGIAECAGFFIGDKLTIGTAGHCIDPATPISVVIETGRDTIERIPARVKTSAGDEDGDMAVLTLDHEPSAPVIPLHVETGDGIIGQRRLKVLVVGYPGDLRELAKSTVGYHAAIAMGCDLDTATIRDSGTGIVNARAIRVQDCQGAHGFSGSPWLVWNKTESRWNLLAIHSKRPLGDRKEEDPFLYPNDFGPAVLQKLQALGYERMRTTDHGRLYAAKQDKLLLDSEQTELVPSMAALEGALLESRNRLVREGNISQQFIASADPTRAQNGLVPKLDKRLAESWKYLASLDHGYDLSRGLVVDRMIANKSSYTQSRDFQVAEQEANEHLGGDIDNGPLRSLLAAIRWFCLDHCSSDSLKSDRQANFTFGDKIARYAVVAAVAGFSYRAYEKMDERLRSAMDIEFDDAPSKGLLVAGGDAWIIDRNTQLPYFIVRDVMRLRHDSSTIYGPFAALEAQCGSAELAVDLPGLWADARNELQRDYNVLTPRSIKGAKTVSARQAHCLLEAHPKTVVLSGLENQLGIPGTMGVSWAATPSMNAKDGVADRLSRLVLDRPGASLSTPMLVYCHNKSCAMSENIVRRLVASGFASVYWLRDGLEGWLQDGFELAPAHNIQSEVLLSDVTPFPEAVALKQAGSQSAHLVPGAKVTFPAGPISHFFMGSNDTIPQKIRDIWIVGDGKLSYSADVINMSDVHNIVNLTSIFQDNMLIVKSNVRNGWKCFEGSSLQGFAKIDITLERLCVVANKIITLSVHVVDEKSGELLHSPKAKAFLNALERDQ